MSNSIYAREQCCEVGVVTGFASSPLNSAPTTTENVMTPVVTTLTKHTVKEIKVLQILYRLLDQSLL